MSEAPQVTPERIMQMAWGYTIPLVLEAAVKNQVFDALDSGPRTLPQISEATGASERGLRAILNALVGVNLLTKEGDRYALTPESSTFLVSTKPTYQGAFLRHISSQLIPRWLNLPEIVRTGRPEHGVNQEEVGGEFFREFVESIFPMSYPSARVLADHLGVDAAGPFKVLDLAAGSGVWGIAAAQKSPEVRVTIVDWPVVIPVAQRVTARFGVADQFRYIAGDLAEADYGSGYQLATLGHILHSEGAERSRALLKRVFDALAPGGTIAIAEWLPNEERTGPPNALIFAVNMLVATEEGDTFTFGEISGWLAEAGFADVRLLEVPGPSPLVLATKPA